MRLFRHHLFSPKIIYGIDVLIEMSLDSFAILQQISRPRNCKAVDVLFLSEYVNVDNKYLEEEDLRDLLKV